MCNSKKIKMKFGKVVTLLAAMSLCVSAFGQKAAIKTNILYDATATVNLGVEIGDHLQKYVFRYKILTL